MSLLAEPKKRNKRQEALEDQVIWYLTGRTYFQLHGWLFLFGDFPEDKSKKMETGFACAVNSENIRHPSFGQVYFDVAHYASYVRISRVSSKPTLNILYSNSFVSSPSKI